MEKTVLTYQAGTRTHLITTPRESRFRHGNLFTACYRYKGIRVNLAEVREEPMEAVDCGNCKRSAIYTAQTREQLERPDREHTE